MNFRLLFVFVAVVAGCSAGQSTEQKVPQCLSMCANQFAACTEEFPGDAAACQPGRSECEQTCRGEKAAQEMEGGESQEVFVPIDAPDAGSNAPSATPDGGI